jgi:hypothetical protein
MTTNLVAINALKTQFNLAESDLTNHKGKIDTLISDVKTGTNNHTAKIDALITDMIAMQARVSGSYSPANSGGTNAGLASDPILLRLERLDDDFTSLGSTVQAHITNYAGRTSSDPLNSLTAVSTGSTGSASGASSGTAADGSAAITAVTNDDSTSTAETTVTPSYTTGVTKVITIGAKGEVRGKRLARQTLNRLRK